MYSIRATAGDVSGRTLMRSAPGADNMTERKASGGGAATSGLQSARSSHEDDRPEGKVCGNRYNRPMHITDVSSAVEACDRQLQQSGRDIMNGRGTATLEVQSSNLVVAEKEKSAAAVSFYPQQHENRRRVAHKNASATNRSNNNSPSHNNDATRPTKIPAAPLTPTRNENNNAPFFSATTPKRKLPKVVNSPLIDAPPTPTSNTPEAGLVHHKDRWRAMSAMAGSHRQNPEVLDLSNRSLPPEALKFGVPPKVASVVTHLKYDGNAVGRHELPAFLDLVSQLFPKLKHISLRGNPCSPSSVDKIIDSPERIGATTSEKIVDAKIKSRLDATIEAANRETVRMQRLYLLYRLPDLISIDGLAVSPTERNLARPSSPAGYRVKKEEWLTKAMAAVKVDVGSGVRVDGADTDDASDGGGTDSVVDSEDGKGACSGSAVEVSICGLVNYVRTPEGNEGGAAKSSLSVQEEKPLESEELQLRTDVPVNEDDKGKGNTLVRGRSMKQVLQPPRGSRPPPSPASKLRPFPAQKQKQGKRLSSRRLWRQRKNNVVSMVDAEEETDEDDEEYDREVGDQENGAHWSGTLETISYMDGKNQKL